MKNLLLASCLLIVLSSCGDDKEEIQREVKFSLTGNEINEAKFNYKSTISSIKTPINGTWDTTIFAKIGETISLDAKSTGGLLKGQVFVGGAFSSEQIDTDPDMDGKTQIKIAHTVR